ncbi:MAG: universal stress protein [Nitrospiraceae bacterium]|nr:MAG: universal stress protein [Nitrospiraceae bacterium]
MTGNFRNILFVLEAGNRDSSMLSRVVRLAQSGGSLLTVAEVVDELPKSMWKMVTYNDLADIQESLVNTRQQGLEQVVAPFREERRGLSMSVRVLTGSPHVEIIREALRNRHDLVIVPLGKESRLKEALFGTTAMHLVQKCPCPVWVSPSRELQRNAILAFVNPDPFDQKKMWLSAEVLETAVRMASLEKRELHVVHAWSKYPEHILYCYAGVPLNVLDKYEDDRQKMNRTWIYSLLNKRMPGSGKCHVHFFEGETETLVSRVAQEFHAGLIVSGIIPRSAGTEIFSEKAIEDALHGTGCSVLVVKPEGFVTPVKLTAAF